ncbi:gag-pol fusion protein PWA37_000801 [Arxiozyma heterogenica]|uniref:gag-pol fusion protein n=1 Tax=Arxiozyma heterogenica TaxID=278026 RepID=UPI002EDD0F16
MMLDSGTTITLVKHKEMLHNLRDSHPESVQITSCSNMDIPYDQEGDLILKTLNGRQIKIHAFYTPTIDHTISSTSDLHSHHLFLNERLNTIEDANGDVTANINTYNGIHWLSNHYIVFPSTANRKSVNALKTKFPLDLIHRIWVTLMFNQSIHPSK